MHVFISADLEGTAGIVAWDQTGTDDKDYEYAIGLMTAEVNALIDGACSAGATRVVVNDSHDSMRNLRPTALDKRAELLSGGPKRLSMMEGISEDFDAVFFSGYHAMAGTRGVLNHTYIANTIVSVSLNGVKVGETGINAAVAGYFGVPVALVCGDDHLAAEAKSLIPGVHTVQTKTAHGRYAALQDHPDVVRARLWEGAALALGGLAGVKPYRPASPVYLELELASSVQADRIERIPGTTRLGDRVVKYNHEEYLTVFQWMLSACSVAGRA